MSIDLPTAIMSAYWTLISRPVVFFRNHLERPPCWSVALGGVLGCMLLTLAGQAIFALRIRPLVLQAATGSGVPTNLLISMQYLGIVSATSVALFVWLSSTVLLIACDILLHDRASPLRILEATATAFYSQWPWLAVVVGLAWRFDAPVRAVQETIGADGFEAARLARWVTEQPTLVAMKVIGECSTVWLHLLFGSAYHAASNVPLPRALAIGSLGYVVPLLIRALP